jgi:D-ribulokinase
MHTARLNCDVRNPATPRRQSRANVSTASKDPPVFALGIDLGTSALRIVAVSYDGAIVAQTQAGLESTGQSEGAATQDPSDWWRATQVALQALGRRVDLKQIRALSVDGTSGTVLAVHKHGHPLSRASMYNDSALQSTIDALARILPENSAARGITSPLARMIEMQRPGIFKILHQADWLSGQFSGLFDIADENNALKSGFDSITRTWPAWMARTQLDPRLLPQVVPAGTDLGPIRPEVAAQFGFTSELRIVSGTTDGCASFLGSGARELGDAVTSLGTTLTLKQICTRPINVARFGVYSHRLGDLWLCGGASNSGGAVLLQFFSREQLSALEGRLIPDDATHLDYYPLPRAGERFPCADALLQPRMEPRPENEARFLQGLLEGIGSIEKAGYCRLQEFGAPALKRVFTVGGGARNQAWRLIRQRILAVPVGTGLADAAFGTALIALRSLKQEPLFAPM